MPASHPSCHATVNRRWYFGLYRHAVDNTRPQFKSIGPRKPPHRKGGLLVGRKFQVINAYYSSLTIPRRCFERRQGASNLTKLKNVKVPLKIRCTTLQANEIVKV